MYCPGAVRALLHSTSARDDILLNATLTHTCHTAHCLISDVSEDHDLITHLTIDLDTQQLLLQMIDQATLVVSAVVDLANSCTVISEPKVSRTASYLIMPPPPAKKWSAADTQSINGLEMLSQAAVGLVDTPNMPDVTNDVYHHDCFALVSDDEDQVLSHLSPEQCASIVDGVFGELDDDFCLGPPAQKRFKTSGEGRSTRVDCCTSKEHHVF
jgi:hypothetical protein